MKLAAFMQGRVEGRDTMNFFLPLRHLYRIPLAGIIFAWALSLVPAQAEIFQMNCKNSRYSYRVTFDDETKRFQWASDAGKVDYYVIRFKTDEDGLTVWGKVRRYGNEFIAYFATEGWMKSFYANGSSMTDVCRASE